MLTVRPHGAFRSGFELLDRSGGTLASFTGSVWRESGQVRIGDQHWDFRRHGSRRFTLEGPGGTLATAERASLWKGTWLVSGGTLVYELVRPSWRSRRYEVRARGRAVGGLHPKGMIGRTTEVDLPAEMPPPLQVFVIAVVLATWRREQSSSAASAP